MDDPLSAVDAHVGQKIFERCIKKALKNCTRVLVTHQLQFMDKFDVIYVMEKGRIQQRGTFKELVEKGLDFAKLLQEEREEKSANTSREKLSEALSLSSSLKNIALHNSSGQEEEILISPPEDFKKGVYVEEEERETGSVKLTVYKMYLLACGSALLLLFLAFISLVLESSTNGLQIWLSVWSDDKFPDRGLKFYMTVYLLILLVQSVTSFIRQFLWAKLSLDA